MKPSLKVREAWFDAGASDFASTCPTFIRDYVPEDAGPVYACPLCVHRRDFRVFMRQAVAERLLTAEHVPPRSRGGQPLVLTCSECNHRAGARLDAHLATAARLAALPFEGRVTVTRGAIALNMSMHADGDGVQLFGDPGRNNPALHASFFRDLQRDIDQGLGVQFAIEFTRHRFDRNRASVALLRAAYLVAFAKYGYRAILGQAFRTIHDRIDSPERELPRLFLIRLAGPRVHDHHRALALISEPEHLKGGLAVQFGNRLVLLPPPGDVEFYQRVASSDGKEVLLRATPLEYPRPGRTSGSNAARSKWRGSL